RPGPDVGADDGDLRHHDGAVSDVHGSEVVVSLVEQVPCPVSEPMVAVDDEHRLPDRAPFPDLDRRRTLEQDVGGELAVGPDDDPPVPPDLAHESLPEHGAGPDDQCSLVGYDEPEPRADVDGTLELDVAVQMRELDEHAASSGCDVGAHPVAQVPGRLAPVAAEPHRAIVGVGAGWAACTFAVVARRDLLRSMACEALSRVAVRAASAVDAERRSRRDIDAVVAACLSAGDDDVMNLHDAGRAVAFLRECLEPTTFECRWLRRDRTPGDPAVTRFEMLVANWTSGVLPIPVPDAWQLVIAADAAGARREPYQEGRWSGDVGLHFLASSTTGRTGRLLASAVRFARPRCCVEIGTA